VNTGSLLTLLNPYGLLGGLVTLSLFALHGAIFVSLKTTGELRDRARDVAVKVAIAAVPLAAAFLVISRVIHGRPASTRSSCWTAAASRSEVLAASFLRPAARTGKCGSASRPARAPAGLRHESEEGPMTRMAA